MKTSKNICKQIINILFNKNDLAEGILEDNLRKLILKQLLCSRNISR